MEITYTGLRPGDKLQEQFVTEREAVLGAPVDGVQWMSSQVWRKRNSLRDSTS